MVVILNAIHLRASGDMDIMVGGHQAASASMATVMAALSSHSRHLEDRLAVTPDAAPVFHAIPYLAGAQSSEKLQNLHGFGGTQSELSRTRDIEVWISPPAPSALASRRRCFRR